MTNILALVQLPPPYNGQSNVNNGMLRLFAKMGFTVDIKNTTSERKNVISYAFNRLRTFIGNAHHIIKHRNSYTFVYLSLSANFGMIESLCYLLLIQNRKRLVIHHHSFAHIGNRSFIFRQIRAACPLATHFVNCNDMASNLCNAFSIPRNQIYSAPNMILAEGVPKAFFAKELTSDTGPFVLGLLGNLTFVKGLKHAVLAFECCLESNVASKLVLAGPVDGKEEQAYLDKMLAIYPGQIIYTGPLYGNDKNEFFEIIDFFLFPSIYKNETQGIVNLEAISRSVPVIAYSQCCVKETIGSAGLCFERQENFAERCEEFLSGLSPDDYKKLREKCQEQFSHVRSIADYQMNQIKEVLDDMQTYREKTNIK